MAKKRDRRRRERRRQHQSAQGERRRQLRRALQEQTEQAARAFGEIRAAAGDPTLSPPAFAERLAGLLEDELLGALLRSPEFASDQGERLGESVGDERARALAAELAARGDHDVRLAWLAVGLAASSGDLGEALRIGVEILPGLDDPDVVAEAAELVASLLLFSGRVGEALDLLDRHCALAPANDNLQEWRARCHARVVAASRADGPAGPGATADVGPGAGAGSDLAPPFGPVDPGQLEAGRASLARFADRSLLYELRRRVEAFVAADPELARWREEAVEEFLAEVREAAGLGPFEELGRHELTTSSILGDVERRPAALEGYAQLAAERSWLFGPEGDEEEVADDDTVLGRFAAAPDTPPDLAAAARDWLRHVRYGLWRLDLPPPAGEHRPGGMWVTDLVTRRSVHAAFAPEQVDGLPRWSVLACALAPVEGVWRSGEVALLLDPDQGDRAADAMLETADHVIAAMAREHGLRAPRPRRRPGGATRPHGVLVEMAEPMEEAQADLTAKVAGVAMSQLVGMLEADARRPPALANTDGDPVEILVATYPAKDPVAVRRSLLVQPDFESDDEEEPAEGDVAAPVRWLGREMSAAEAATSLAQFRAEAARRGWGPIAEPEGPRRWLRGMVRFERSQVRVEVNSRRRFEDVTLALRLAGAGSPVVEQMVDPALDLPVSGAGLRGGRADDPEAEAAWLEHWVDERVPALGGRTPRAAARDPEGRVLLESLLRRFEYDADLAAARGDRPRDVDRLRDALGIRDWMLEDEPAERAPAV